MHKATKNAHKMLV